MREWYMRRISLSVVTAAAAGDDGRHHVSRTQVCAKAHCAAADSAHRLQLTVRLIFIPAGVSRQNPRSSHRRCHALDK